MAKIFSTEKLSLNGDNIRIQSTGAGVFEITNADSTSVLISRDSIETAHSSLNAQDITNVSSLNAQDVAEAASRSEKIPILTLTFLALTLKTLLKLLVVPKKIPILTVTFPALTLKTLLKLLVVPKKIRS